MQVIIKVAIGELILRNSEIGNLEVVQELGQHTTCHVDFTRDESQPLALEDVIKQPISVTLGAELGQTVQVFQGKITDGSVTHLLHVGARFSIEAISPSVRHEFREAVYYPESKLGDIVTKLGAKMVGEPRLAAEKFDYVQWNESDWDFLTRLADRHGCFLVATGPQVEVRSSFVEKDHQLVFGQDLHSVTARVRPSNHGITGASYDPKEKSTHRHFGVRQEAASIGGAAKLVAAAKEIANSVAGGGDPLFAEPTGRDAKHGDFRQQLRLESERALGSAVMIEGTSQRHELMVGETVELLGGADFALTTTGKFGLVRVVHQFDGAHQHYSNQFLATPWKNFSNFTRPDRPTLIGPVTAEVVANDDPEGQGRVRVAYRWQNDNITNWARLAASHAGNDRGMLFVPEIGDEVLVSFIHGDAESPVVIGSLWNGKDRAPKNEAQNDVKWLRTRSGNTIEFRDAQDGATIEIYTPKGECLIQLHSPRSGKSCLTIHSKGDLHLDVKGELRIKSQTFLQIVEADSKRKVGAGESVDITNEGIIKTGGNLSLVGGMNTAIKAGANLDAVATAMNNIVGALVNIQPPGFMSAPVMAKTVTIQEPDLGDKQVPEVADPSRSADAPTPRQGS